MTSNDEGTSKLKYIMITGFTLALALLFILSDIETCRKESNNYLNIYRLLFYSRRTGQLCANVR
jgi:hypothetical protein